MPRSFDSDDFQPELTFVENVQCPDCGEIFPGTFVDYTQSLSVQDMVDSPTGTQQCPSCGRAFEAELSGWMFYGEAG